MNTKEKIIEEFRKKWGRFYISDTTGVDWIKPKECLHKSGVFCIASDDIENDIVKVLSLQKQEILREIEKIVLEEAIIKFNATPEVGEEFDLEKYNYANKLLNEMNTFIWQELKQTLNK